jgi:pyruvate dehydrogenase E1 component
MATSERTANSTRRRGNGHASAGDASSAPPTGDPLVAGPAAADGAAPDIDAVETAEWLEAIDAVIAADGAERARDLLTRVIERAQHSGTGPIASLSTAYVNTIPVDREPTLPSDPQLERRLRSIVRWNAMAMVVRANKTSSELGGHIASFQSLATLYEVGFNHFWHAPSDDHGGDLVYFQGHSSPGNYARAYLEGRLTESQLDNFRQEVDGDGLSSYPHPWLMPDFWQFPTVSLGIGAISSIYQARFMKYLGHRGIAETAGRKVWAFLGDGEMDEPESMGATALAGREKLDNLIWVVNCNLQRLDGPVRGNGKIIQELESDFRGAGWNVIKVIWGSRWDPLLAADTDGALVKVMEDCVDGDYQTFKSRDGAYVREHFFGRDPRLLERVKDMTDDQIWYLNRGGHDQQKVYAAYRAAVEHTGQPTVILAKTIKGYGMGVSGEGQMITHQAKKMTEAALLAFRDRFELPLTDEQVKNAEYYKPPEDSPEMRFMRERRAGLGGSLPARAQRAEPLSAPSLELFKNQLEGTGEREISTTMAFVRILAALLRDKAIGPRVVPIVPDESRTFGMEGLFRQVGIYSPVGQLYRPQDSEQLMFYKEDQTGQILEEGITEAGSISSFVAAGTSYSTHATSMVPFYIYYSMFGYQRVGDLVWAAGDSRTRGFMLGGTAGRTTLNGEGLQHEDGHSHLLFSVVPNCRAYDPAFGYEVAVIIQDGLHRMLDEQEDVFYYLTLMNENYPHPAMLEGAEEGILRGMHLLSEAPKRSRKPVVQLLGSGTILLEVMAAAELLETDWGVLSDVWSVTSFSELRRDGIEAERWTMLHPDQKPRAAFVTEQLTGRRGPVIASTDYLRAVPDQIRQWVAGSEPDGRRYRTLGTDGYGRSDFRAALRRFFEVDRWYVTVAALGELAAQGAIDPSVVTQAIEKYGIDTEAPIPTKV